MNPIIRRIAFGLTAGVCSLMLAMPPVPRPASPLTIVEASGKQAALSTYKGKVVLVQFLFTTCQHCQHAAELYAKLQTELGPSGFQAVGVAFNDEVQAAPGVLHAFAEHHKLNFPVGTVTRTTVLNYLGLSQMEMLRVPQIVIIDRKGVIRVQSSTQGSPELQDEAHLRSLITGLLQEAR